MKKTLVYISGILLFAGVVCIAHGQPVAGLICLILSFIAGVLTMVFGDVL